MAWAYVPSEPKNSLEEHICSAYELYVTHKLEILGSRLFCIFKEICPYYEDTKKL